MGHVTPHYLVAMFAVLALTVLMAVFSTYTRPANEDALRATLDSVELPGNAEYVDDKIELEDQVLGLYGGIRTLTRSYDVADDLTRVRKQVGSYDPAQNSDIDITYVPLSDTAESTVLLVQARSTGLTQEQARYTTTLALGWAAYFGLPLLSLIALAVLITHWIRHR